MRTSGLLGRLTGGGRAADSLSAVERPADEFRQVAAGRDTDRVLVAGSGPSTGAGVGRQEQALPGALAAALAARTGRGAAVDVVAGAGTGPLAADLLPLLQPLRLSHYDAVVLTPGHADAEARTTPDRYRAALVSLLLRVGAALAPGTEIVVLAAQPLQHPAAGRAAKALDAHAKRLDAVAEQVCSGRRGVRFLRSDAAAGPLSAVAYAALAKRLAEHLAGSLDGLAATPPAGSARLLRRSGDPELLRQAALDRTGVVGTGSSARLDRLVLAARDAFGVRGAAVTLLDGDRQVHKAGIGLTVDQMPRDVSVCNRTIRQDGALVVPDLDGEAIADLGWRFYAGYPIESPDGFRIGALCVFDPDPRADGSVDTVKLAQLAAQVQAELWSEVRDRGRAAR